MSRERKAGSQVVRGRVYGRFWLGGDKRESVPLAGVPAGSDAAIKARCEVIADAASKLVAAGRSDRARDMAEQLGSATGQKRIDAILKSIAKLTEQSGPIENGITVRQFGEKWTTGELARTFPDHVRKKKTAAGDKQTFEQYVYPVCGNTPLVAFELSDAEDVMSRIGDGLSPARRRHVAQAMHRLLKIAVYPAKILKVSPLPPGFLPKLGPGKAKQYLYPDEDRKLLGCTGVPLVFRFTYGFLAREGMRLSEALLSDWDCFDLERGAVRLDENKTDDPRSWALAPSVVAALRRWKEMRHGLGPFEGVADLHAAVRFRAHLDLAGVTRPELFLRTDARRPIVAHDLRATFVTVGLANGRSETWVADRTGHKSTLMIQKYRRSARTLAELGVGDFTPMDQAIAWSETLARKQKAIGKLTSGTKPGARVNIEKTAGGPSRARTGTPKRAADFKSAKNASHVAVGREKQHGTTSGDVAQRVLADNLPIPELARGAASLTQIRTEWSAFEAAGAAMEATDSGATGDRGAADSLRDAAAILDGDEVDPS
jgi:integrase